MADEDIYFLAATAKDCGMTWMTSHNKAATRGLVSQPITVYGVVFSE